MVLADIAADVTEAVYGPFSDDFRWVRLQNEHEPIALTQAQAAVFAAL